MESARASVRWSVLCLAAACTSNTAAPIDAAAPDASTTVTYGLSARDDNPHMRPPPADPASVFIDGVETRTLTTTYPDRAALEASSHHVEMRYGDTALATYDVAHGDGDIGACIGPAATLTGWTDSLATHDNGELRFAGYEGETNGGACVGDVGYAGCFDSNCGSGAECSVRATHFEPFFSRYACAPIGTQQAGEACTFTADPAGAYADCATGLACVDGTCHVRCTQLTGSNACSTCAFVPGYPDEVSVCP